MVWRASERGGGGGGGGGGPQGGAEEHTHCRAYSLQCQITEVIPTSGMEVSYSATQAYVSCDMSIP